MKPEVYYENKNEHIINLGTYVNFQIPRAAERGGPQMDELRLRVMDFIAKIPDESDLYTDVTWVTMWKGIYARLSDSIRDIKEIGDYRLDSKRRELGTIANALLGARRAVFWIK